MLPLHRLSLYNYVLVSITIIQWIVVVSQFVECIKMNFPSALTRRRPFSGGFLARTQKRRFYRETENFPDNLLHVHKA